MQDDGWEEVELVVDSGASETAIGPEVAQSVEAMEGQSYRQGVKYDVAKGIRERTEDDNVRSIGMLLTIAPEVISTVQDDGWEEVNLVVDSGASETVTGPEMVQSVEAMEGGSYRQGVKYEVANGTRIPNLGTKKFVGVSGEGMTRQMKAQVCDINKGLLSVSKLVEQVNRVVFGPKGSYIEDLKTQERMYMKAWRGLYMLKLWTKSAGKRDF